MVRGSCALMRSLAFRASGDADVEFKGRLLRAVQGHPDWPDADLSSLRLVVAGSSIVPLDLIMAFHARGVPVGAEVARRLNAPFDIVLVRKLGAPHQPELAIGAIVDGSAPQTVLNEGIVPRLGVTPDVIAEIAPRQLAVLDLDTLLAPGTKHGVALTFDDGMRSVHRAAPARNRNSTASPSRSRTGRTSKPGWRASQIPLATV